MDDSNIKQRFTTKFHENPMTGCWDWAAAFFKNKKYGIFYWGVVDGKEIMKTAHKAAWELFIGDVPKGKILCHKCNNGGCVNPDHLYAGTHLSNAKDRENAGHTSKWDKRYNFKRNANLVKKVIELKNAGYRADDIAKELKIGRTTCYRCLHQAVA